MTAGMALVPEVIPQPMQAPYQMLPPHLIMSSQYYNPYQSMYYPPMPVAVPMNPIHPTNVVIPPPSESFDFEEARTLGSGKSSSSPKSSVDDLNNDLIERAYSDGVCQLHFEKHIYHSC